MDHRREALRARRAARASVLRRRRAGLAVAAVALVAAVLVVSVMASGHPARSGHAGTNRQVGRATTSRVGGRGTAPGGTPAGASTTTTGSTLSEVAAVRRLAAYGLPLFCGGSSKRMVALTFDDGPGPYTPLAIKKLREARLRATFFLVGKEIRAYPGLAGLEKPYSAAGDHTMTHPFLPGLSEAAMTQEIAGAKALIEQATGRPVALFRPPYEGRSPAISAEVKALGLLEVLWSTDSADSLGANYAGIEHNVVAGLRPGSIILMHENRGQTIRALPVIFAALAREHLRAVTVPELVAEDPPSPAQLRAGGRGCGVSARSGSGG